MLPAHTLSRRHLFSNVLVAIVALHVWGLPTGACGQLTLLSQGDSTAKWRETQLSLVQQQLQSSVDLDPQLKQELQAQANWLGAWKPGKLTSEPLWPTAKLEQLEEPIIDPNGLAKELRQRLLGPAARPTSADTKLLQQMLEQHPDDLGVRQLHLHWLDQVQYRKLYPLEIADTALSVAGLMTAKQPKVDPQELHSAIAFCYYRRGRALAYRELPDVVDKKPIQDPQKHEAELVGAYRQLKELVPAQRPEFILLDIRMLRRDHWNGRALELLEEYGQQVNLQWYLKKRRDILRDLGWQAAAEEAAAIYAAKFPDEVAAEKSAP